MAKLNPFLRFNDNKCREAMNFYKDCLGGELYFMPVKESPMAKDIPEDKQDLIMHSTLKRNDWVLLGSDMLRDKATYGDGVGLSLDCESVEEIKMIFNRLADGGEVFAPPKEMYPGATFAMVTDKYGVEWMLSFVQ